MRQPAQERRQRLSDGCLAALIVGCAVGMIVVAVVIAAWVSTFLSDGHA